jgi:hypothetical protein
MSLLKIYNGDEDMHEDASVAEKDHLQIDAPRIRTAHEWPRAIGAGPEPVRLALKDCLERPPSATEALLEQYDRVRREFDLARLQLLRPLPVSAAREACRTVLSALSTVRYYGDRAIKAGVRPPADRLYPRWLDQALHNARKYRIIAALPADVLSQDTLEDTETDDHHVLLFPGQSN